MNAFYSQYIYAKGVYFEFIRPVRLLDVFLFNKRSVFQAYLRTLILQLLEAFKHGNLTFPSQEFSF